MCCHVHAMVHTCKSEGNLPESVLAFYYMGSGESNLGPQSWWQAPSPTEHSSWPTVIIFSCYLYFAISLCSCSVFTFCILFSPPFLTFSLPVYNFSSLCCFSLCPLTVNSLSGLWFFINWTGYKQVLFVNERHRVIDICSVKEAKSSALTPTISFLFPDTLGRNAQTDEWLIPGRRKGASLWIYQGVLEL